MGTESGAHSNAIAIHHVKDARWKTGFMENLAKQIGGEWRNFTRLKHHGATGRKRRRHLAADLVHGPVPRSDERTHANGLFAHQSRADKLFEFEVFEHPDDF